MRRTGHDFAEVHVFREFPAGAREQHDRGSYPLRAVGVKTAADMNQNVCPRQRSNPDRNSTVIRKPVNPGKLKDDRTERPEKSGKRSGNAEKNTSSSDRVICQKAFFILQESPLDCSVFCIWH